MSDTLYKENIIARLERRIEQLEAEKEEVVAEGREVLKNCVDGWRKRNEQLELEVAAWRQASDLKADRIEHLEAAIREALPYCALNGEEILRRTLEDKERPDHVENDPTINSST